MRAFHLIPALALLLSGSALAQTTPSTTSGPISGSGATTSGTAPASVGPAGQAPSQEYRRQMRNDRATGKGHRKASTKHKAVSSDGEKAKTDM